MARFGDVAAPVDTGARFTTVQRNCMAHLSSLPTLPGQGELVAAAGDVMRVLGCVKLALRYKDRVLDMDGRVVDKLILPLILGFDWIDVAGAMVYSEYGVGRWHCVIAMARRLWRLECLPADTDGLSFVSKLTNAATIASCDAETSQIVDGCNHAPKQCARATLATR